VKPAAQACEAWFLDLLDAGATVVVPEIADYEVRRELHRIEQTVGVRRLDSLGQLPAVRYLPITTRAMRLAAQFWAEARRAGRPTADRHALDADVILAAQTRLLIDDGHDAIVATTNLPHLTRLVPAAEWPTITA
jgi:hypothetical protein